MADSTRSIDPRDPDGLERQIEETRAELARTIDTIADRVAPRNVARRGADRLKEKAGHVVETLTGTVNGAVPADVTDPETDLIDGEAAGGRRLPVPPAVLIGGAVAVAAVTAFIVIRRIRRR